MKIIGIIAEYNPFHLGHLYQINKIKELYPDSLIIVIVSSTFTQRGDISIINKWDKTKIVLEHNIDLVVELPIFYGINNAEYKTLLKENLDKGYSYPKASYDAIETLSNIKISTPNDILALSYIEENYGKEYVGSSNKEKGKGKKIQDAHEAIRPTDMTLSPVKIKDLLSRDQFRLYQLIWNRFLASRMEDAKYETTSIKIDANGYRFHTSASKLVFDGFMAVYVMDNEKEEVSASLKAIDKESKLALEQLEEKQHFTQPPAHYTEALLVKTLEELGIGRPSTYAPTITTIIARRYIVKENKNLYVTELGEAVNQMMKKAFPSIVDVTFTANLESLLDMVEEGSVQWKTVVRNFYPDLEEAVENALKELEEVKIEDEITEEICEVCGRNMVIKYGPYGKFLACPGFPECKFTKPHFEKVGVPCPLCGKEVVLKKTKKGRKYYGCENNPECEFMSWQKPSKKKCPNCGGYMLEKGNKLLCADESCGFVCENEKQKEATEI